MQREQARFKALPEIGDEVFRLVLDTQAGIVQEYGNLLANVGSALSRVDEDIGGLVVVNPNLARLVQGTVEGLYSVFADSLSSEQDRATLRAVCYFNSLVLLRALDLQLRREAER